MIVDDYDWADDARKCYTLAIETLRMDLLRRKIIAALKHRAQTQERPPQVGVKGVPASGGR